MNQRLVWTSPERLRVAAALANARRARHGGAPDPKILDQLSNKELDGAIQDADAVLIAVSSMHPLCALRAAAWPLLKACETDFTNDQTEGRAEGDTRCTDDEAVAKGDAGESAITFGMIRALRAAMPREETR
jgi:hypothetical protein